MVKSNKDKKYKHLTEVERYKIEGYLDAKKKTKEIAELLGKSQRTIQREIKRGKVVQRNTHLEDKEVYCADYAQLQYEKAQRRKGRNYKIGNDYKLLNFIEDKIKNDKFSPDAVIGLIKKERMKFNVSICTNTVYNYIDSGMFLNLTNKDLPVKKNGKKRTYRKIRKVSLNNLKGTSIAERPEHIDNRDEYGHWEMDCVVSGKKTKGKAALLVLSERMTREELIFKIPEQTQACVIKELDKLERKLGFVNFKDTFKTITVDNGGEFLNFEGIEKSVMRVSDKRTKIYYAHPYAAWERGTNECLNRLIRRFVPKGTKLDDIPKKAFKRIENWMNNYPRRMFDYMSPLEYKEAMAS